MCKQKHMMPGKTDAKCTEECVKAGASYALVSGDKVYTLSAKQGIIAPFAGKMVQVQGNLRDQVAHVNPENGVPASEGAASAAPSDVIFSRTKWKICVSKKNNPTACGYQPRVCSS